MAPMVLQQPRLTALRTPAGAARVRAARAPLPVAFALPTHVLALKQAEGPGSGSRHYPADLHQEYDTRRRNDEAEKAHHDMMSTEACYRMFPLLTHASVPLRVDDPEPAGLTAQRVGDAGPATGRRRRPAPADSERGRAPLPYPATHPTDLRRELVVKHAPELLLAQQQQQRQQRQA